MKRRSPVFWILTIVIAPIVLGIAGIVGGTIFVLARNARLMNDLQSIRDPRLRLARLAAAGNPDMDVKVDENAGSLTLRDKKSGDIETVTYADIGKDPKKAPPVLPAWVIVYPDATREFVFSRRTQSHDGLTQGAKFLLKTADPASKVLAFYRQRIQELGLKPETTIDHDWEHISGKDGRRSLSAGVDKVQPGPVEIHLEFEEKQ